MARMCILCHIFTNYSSVLFYGVINYLRNDSLWLSAHALFSVPNGTNFWRFWGILRNNNCHWKMAIHVFPGLFIPQPYVCLCSLGLPMPNIKLLCFSASALCTGVQLSVHIPTHGSWLCHSINYVLSTHVHCILLVKLSELSEFLNYLSRFHFHLANDSNAVCSPLVFISFNHFKTGVWY